MAHSRSKTKRFDPMLPLCDGRPAPPRNSGDPVEQRMREFADAYQRLNVAYERLRKTRTRESSEAPDEILEEIDRIVHDRDALEDRLAPEGFYAEPVIEQLVTVDLLFSYAQKRSIAPATPEQIQTSTFSLFIPMPKEGEDMEVHLRGLLGPLFGIQADTSQRKKKDAPERRSGTGKKTARSARTRDIPSRTKGKEITAPRKQVRK
jgi:hypothetical protein